MTIWASVPVAKHNHPAACADSGYLLMQLCFLDPALCTMMVDQGGLRAGSSQTAHNLGLKQATHFTKLKNIHNAHNFFVDTCYLVDVFCLVDSIQREW